MRRALLDFAAAVLLVALCALLVALVGPQAHAQQVPDVPRSALAYRAELTRTARAVWGMEAPVAAFAAQVHQESAWRPAAVSRAGAAGLAQFMPATARWISGLYPELQANQPFNPAWALRALVTYDRWLYQRTPASYAPRDRMWVALRAYNGGLGHWQAEARNATGASREAVDSVCGTAKRSPVHCAENLGYPHRILIVLQPRYAPWGGML
ncbi:MAG: transglycosylase SLT domain-containing protein [Ramlibacter sp.]|nr:transglycosylase SLT domain-containing protein [Ramlibacter sp.]